MFELIPGGGWLAGNLVKIMLAKLKLSLAKITKRISNFQILDFRLDFLKTDRQTAIPVEVPPELKKAL